MCYIARNMAAVCYGGSGFCACDLYRDLYCSCFYTIVCIDLAMFGKGFEVICLFCCVVFSHGTAARNNLFHFRFFLFFFEHSRSHRRIGSLWFVQAIGCNVWTPHSTNHKIPALESPNSSCIWLFYK